MPYRSRDEVPLAGQVTAQRVVATGPSPIPLAFADPDSNDYAQASPASTSAIARACHRLRVVVGDSGCVISLDGGTTDHFHYPPNTMGTEPVAIASGADIRVKRYTSGVAMTDLKVSVQ